MWWYSNRYYSADVQLSWRYRNFQSEWKRLSCWQDSVPYHTTQYPLGSLTASVMECDGMQAECFFFPTAVSEGLWLPYGRVIWSCVVWTLTPAALWGTDVSKWGIAADWFFYLTEKKMKKSPPAWSRLNQKLCDFLPWEAEKSWNRHTLLNLKIVLHSSCLQVKKTKPKWNKG